MAFTVRDFEDLVLLDRPPGWLEALCPRLLIREWLQAPETLREIEGTLRGGGLGGGAHGDVERAAFLPQWGRGKG